MNWLQFGRLIHSIYRRDGRLPDLDWIEGLGLLAVKLAQVHALRIDFLEEDKCRHLAKLYRRAATIPAADFRSLIARAGIESFDASFERIEETALASASVGQVHRGKLRSGEEVVIKAVKADVRRQFESDVQSLRRLFALITRVYPALKRVGNPLAILSDIETYTLSELDLRNEIAGQHELRDILETSSTRFDLSRLRFPRVYEQISNSNVMVSDFLPGPTIDELLERGEFPYEMLVELFRVHGFYMFCIGRFHGDLHPGNVIVQDEQFWFIDTGFVGHVSDRLRTGLFEFFTALSEYDYPNCAAALNSMSVEPLDGRAYARFLQDFELLYKDFRAATVSDVSLTKRMMETIRLGVESGMAFEEGIFSIIRSLMYLDGMVLRCNPNAVLLRDMRGSIGEFRAAM